MKFIPVLLSVVVCVIYLQTLFFKFTGAEESIYIFSTLGMEPVGRYLSGMAELVVAIFILIPKFRPLFGLVSVGLISGALVSHLTVLGVEVKGDGGGLFFLALAVWICSAALALLERDSLVALIQKFLEKTKK